MSQTHFHIGKDFNPTLDGVTTQKKSENIKKDIFLLAKYSSIGYYLVAPFLIGVFFGFWIDNYFKSKPTFTLMGIGFGLISSVYSLYKLLKEQEH